MKAFKVLGSGCKKCNQTADMIQSKAADLGLEISIEKITDLAQIMSYGVMSTPGVVLEDVVVHAGGLPSDEDITTWLKS